MLANSGFVLSDTPKNPQELKKFLERLPINSDIIFFDYAGLESVPTKYHTGIPPFLKLHKENSNALNTVVYVVNDNRQAFANLVIPEKDIDTRIDAILRQLKVLNKVATKSYKSSLPNVGSAVDKARGVIINRLDKKRNN